MSATLSESGAAVPQDAPRVMVNNAAPITGSTGICLMALSAGKVRCRCTLQWYTRHREVLLSAEVQQSAEGEARRGGVGGGGRGCGSGGAGLSREVRQ